MSLENVEIVRRVVTAFNAGGDAPLADELVEADAKFDPLLAGVEGASYRGPAGVMRWVAAMHDAFAEVHSDCSEIEEHGDLVVARGKTTGVGRVGGVPVEQDWVLAARFDAGKISSAAIRRTGAEALEAVRVSE